MTKEQEIPNDFSYFQKALQNEDIERLKQKYPDGEWKAIVARIADLQVENAMLKKTHEELHNKKAIEEEQELIKYIKDHALLQKYDKNERMIFIPFYFPNKKSKKYPYKVVVLSKKNTKFVGGSPQNPRHYPYLRGIALEQTEHSQDIGPFVHLILGKKPDYSDKDITAIGLGYGFQIPSLVRSFNTIVTQMKSVGHITLELDEEGRHPPIQIQIPNNPPIQRFHDGVKEMLNVDILKLREEGVLNEASEKIITGLYDKIDTLRREVIMSRQAQNEAVTKRMNAEITLAGAKPMIDDMPAMMKDIQEKNNDLVEGLMDMKTSANLNDQKRLQMEILHTALMDNINDVMQKYADGMSSSQKDKLSDDIWANTEKTFDMMQKAGQNIKALMIRPETPKSPPEQPPSPAAAEKPEKTPQEA